MIAMTSRSFSILLGISNHRPWARATLAGRRTGPGGPHRHRQVRRVHSPRKNRPRLTCPARDLHDDFTHRGWRVPYLEARDLRLTAHFDSRDWQVSHNDPIHHAVNYYPEVITLTAQRPARRSEEHRVTNPCVAQCRPGSHRGTA
jgi:hypothetical protein